MSYKSTNINLINKIIVDSIIENDYKSPKSYDQHRFEKKKLFKIKSANDKYSKLVSSNLDQNQNLSLSNNHKEILVNSLNFNDKIKKRIKVNYDKLNLNHNSYSNFDKNFELCKSMNRMVEKMKVKIFNNSRFEENTKNGNFNIKYRLLENSNELVSQEYRKKFTMKNDSNSNFNYDSNTLSHLRINKIRTQNHKYNHNLNLSQEIKINMTKKQFAYSFNKSKDRFKDIKENKKLIFNNISSIPFNNLYSNKSFILEPLKD